MATRSSENAMALEVPEKLAWVAERGGMKSLQDSVNDGPCTAALNSPSLSSCFHPRRVQEANEDLSPLLHENAELQAEQAALLLRNSELVSQTLLLKIQNQRLKEQLERQLQNRDIGFSSSVSSSGSLTSSAEDYSTDSDGEEEEVAMRAAEASLRKVKLASSGREYGDTYRR